jgi:hypothetical protein
MNNQNKINLKYPYPLSKSQIQEFLKKLERVYLYCQNNLNLSKRILTDMGINKKDQKIL